MIELLKYPWIKRSVRKGIRITRDANTLRGYTKLAEEIVAAADEVQTFTLEPNAWMEAFGFHSPEQQQKLNERLIARIRLLEARAEKKRTKEKKRVFGRERLLAQVFDTSYRPKRKGRRMWCLSEKRSVRVKFIRFFKALMQKARAVRERWKLGEGSTCKWMATAPCSYNPSWCRCFECEPCFFLLVFLDGGGRERL